MDFELTDEQHALQEVVHDLVERDCPATLLRAVFEGKDDGSSFWKVLVENDWPGLAIAEAFRSGNLGVMDFYRLKNIQADTAMRDSIAEGDGGEKEA